MKQLCMKIHDPEWESWKNYLRENNLGLTQFVRNAFEKAITGIDGGNGHAIEINMDVPNEKLDALMEEMQIMKDIVLSRTRQDALETEIDKMHRVEREMIDRIETIVKENKGINEIEIERRTGFDRDDVKEALWELRERGVLRQASLRYPFKWEVIG